MNKDVLTQYKEYLMNPFKLNDHMNIIRMLKSNEYIKNKLIKINELLFASFVQMINLF